MKAQINLTTPSKNRTKWTCINCIIIILCIYGGIFQQYHRVNVASPMILVIIGWHTLNALKRLWIDTGNMNWIKYLIPVVILATLGLSGIAIGRLQGVYYNHQLANHGQIITGEVIFVKTNEFPEFDFYYNRYAAVRYTFNNKHFTQDIDNKKQKLILGDSVKLRLSTKNPLIIEAVDN